MVVVVVLVIVVVVVVAVVVEYLKNMQSLNPKAESLTPYKRKALKPKVLTPQA